MLSLYNILLFILCYVTTTFSISSLKIQSILPPNGTIIPPPELTERGLPFSPARVDYHDTHPDFHGYFCRFLPGRHTRHSRVFSIFQMSPAIMAATREAFFEASYHVSGMWEPMFPPAQTFSENGVSIMIWSAADHSHGAGLEVYALMLCMQKLVEWGHQYSFSNNSHFEYWVNEQARGQYRKGMGSISFDI